ncbi:MAG: orotidine-5'-phosphate decarboxylase [Candidatus Cloacimonas sp.]|jgi:orotidine-5'-phosphate decarboxylase|nr:orotidine-5'-phosphate decarboxylase [Candidatus Cloacimonadota bacterium]
MLFWDKYDQATKLHKSHVCLGLDSDIEMIPSHLLKHDNPIWEFNKEIVDATKNRVGAYKLNFAFYLSNGPAGLDALLRTINHIPSYVPIILDVKVGDISNTMVHYAKAFYEYFKVDSLTVNPLMGEDVFTPLLTYKDKFLFALVITSNRSATDFLKKNDLYVEIANKVNKLGHKKVGAVIGATNPKELKEVRNFMPEALFLIPGIGAQGGNLFDVVTNTIASKKNPAILINSSRGIIFKDNSPNYIEAVVQETEELRRTINQLI